MASKPIQTTGSKTSSRKKDLEFLELKIYIGMRVSFTHNIDKVRDYVNGMGAVVEDWCEKTKALICKTDTGHEFPVRPWTNTDLGNLTYYPVKPGYASTVLKMAGAELPHAVLWLDVPHQPGAAYTGMSRVQYRKDLLLGGNLNCDYFTPAEP